jgi:glutathione peroxidase
MTTAHEFTVTSAEGDERSLEDFHGQLLLIVNVASKCGLTPQYSGLEALHRAEAPRGLQILGFPCNQFGGQEPGTAEEIADFCSTSYDVTFPILAKVDVNGADADPLFVHLREDAPGDFGPAGGPLYDILSERFPERLGTDEIKWNFTKFLVGRDGETIKRYEPYVTPEEIQTDLQKYLG